MPYRFDPVSQMYRQGQGGEVSDLAALVKRIDEALADAQQCAEEGFIVDEDGTFRQARRDLRELVGEWPTHEVSTVREIPGAGRYYACRHDETLRRSLLAALPPLEKP